MTNTMTVRIPSPRMTPARAARCRARRRRALRNTLLEALTTIGLGVSFVLCAVVVVCVA